MHMDEKASYEERFKEWVSRIPNRIKATVLKHRVVFIVSTALLGGALFVLFYGGFDSFWPPRALIKTFVDLKKDRVIFSRILFIALAVPVSFYFWYLRNNDKLESIEQAKRGNQLNTFSNATTLFFAKDNSGANAAGIRLLLNLRNEFNVYQQEINLMIRFRNLSKLNLQGVNLQNMDLEGANLQGTNLRGTNLQGTNLRGANLQGASLRCAYLRGTKLQGADLQLADLQLANLQGAKLQFTKLQGAKLQNAHLQGASLQKAKLQNANFQGAELQFAYILINPNDLQKTYSRAELEYLLKNPTAAGKWILVYIIENNDQYSFKQAT